MNTSEEVYSVLHQYWGFTSLRPQQEALVRASLTGESFLAILPTGGGKSLCFQLPALLKPGVCLVVCPLISLMQDQVKQLKAKRITAAAIYSGLHWNEVDAILDNAVLGKVKFLYVSPERLETEVFIARVQRMSLSLLVVDEAHCISQWGHDFRPSYLNIKDLKVWFPQLQTVAYTASATTLCQKEICERLDLREGKIDKIYYHSIRRSNLSYVVFATEDKEQRMLHVLSKLTGPGIVYVRSRRKTQSIVQFLIKNKISAVSYHAGISTTDRSQRQDAWSKGKYRVMVATNAFGMGIDQANVRVVIHLDLPESLEAYYQEAGRAGRDGLKAYPVLIYSPSDSSELQEKVRVKHPTIDNIRKVYHALVHYYQLPMGAKPLGKLDFSIDAFCKRFDLPPVETWSALKVLEQQEWLVMTDAVHTPSQLMIVVDPSMFYSFQLKHPTVEPLMKTMLRLYGGGLYTGFVDIQEKTLLQAWQKLGAFQLTDLQFQLNYLVQNAIIQYRPSNDEGGIWWLKERVDPSKLMLDFAVLEHLKKMDMFRAKSMIDYANMDKICRQVVLGTYFGEGDTKSCGLCDVCLHQKRNLNTVQIEEKLTLALQVQSYYPSEILSLFLLKDHEEVHRVLDLWLGEEKIRYDGEGKLGWVD